MSDKSLTGPGRIGILLATLVAVLLPCRVVATDRSPKPIVLHGSDGEATDALHWSTSSGERRVLEVEGDDEERWLVLTIRDQARVSLGGPRMHPLGYFGDQFELRDETTGWWVRYSRGTPDFAPPPLPAHLSLDQMLDRIRKTRRESGAETVLEIWTSDGIVVRRSTVDGPVLYSEIAPVLHNEGLGDAMPEAAQEATRFLVEMHTRNPRLDHHWESEFDFLGLIVDALTEPEVDGAGGRSTDPGD